jgi:hypothetical protein
VASDIDSSRERINMHGAINLESGQTRMIDVQTVDAASTITLLDAETESLCSITTQPVASGVRHG